MRQTLRWLIEEDKHRGPFAADAIKVITHNGGDPKLTDVHGDNILHFAIKMKLGTNCISGILEGQPKPSPLVTTRNNAGWTPMRILVSRDVIIDMEKVRLLKDYGGDINDKDSRGNTLLHIVLSHKKRPRCFFFGNAPLIEEFLELGADVNAKNNNNHVPLRYAINPNIFLFDYFELCPSVDILNDDSCWDGPFFDYVFENISDREDGQVLEAAIGRSRRQSCLGTHFVDGDEVE